MDDEDIYKFCNLYINKNRDIRLFYSKNSKRSEVTDDIIELLLIGADDALMCMGGLNETDISYLRDKYTKIFNAIELVF